MSRISTSSRVTSIGVDSGFDTLSVGPLQATVGTISVQIFAANPDRKYAHIVNNSASNIYIQYQADAVLNQGIRIPPGAFFTLESTNLWLGIVNAIGVMSGQLIDILEGE